MIYAIQSVDGGPIKFGRAANPARRLLELQTGSPSKLVLLASLNVHDDNEGLIHRYLRRDRLYGEWFRPSPEALAMVEVLKSEGEECFVINFIYERDFETIQWSRRKLGIPAVLPGDPPEQLAAARQP